MRCANFISTWEWDDAGYVAPAGPHHTAYARGASSRSLRPERSRLGEAIRCDRPHRAQVAFARFDSRSFTSAGHPALHVDGGSGSGGDGDPRDVVAAAG